MKLEQQQQAQQLYFQTGMNKSEIAESLGVNRRTIHNWVQQNSWEKLKKSAENIPVFLAENCYQILGNYQKHLLSEERKDTPPTPQEINAMYKLTLTISKLTKKSTLNESMELFTHLSETILAQDPDLAYAIQPYIIQLISSQAGRNTIQYRSSHINEEGYIPTPDKNIQEQETKLDAEDLYAWADEKKAQAAQASTSSHSNSHSHSTPKPSTPPHSALPLSALNLPHSALPSVGLPLDEAKIRQDLLNILRKTTPANKPKPVQLVAA